MKTRWEQDGAGGLFGIGYFDLGEGEMIVRFDDHNAFLAFRWSLSNYAEAVRKKARDELLKQIGSIQA